MEIEDILIILILILLLLILLFIGYYKLKLDFLYPFVKNILLLYDLVKEKLIIMWEFIELYFIEIGIIIKYIIIEILKIPYLDAIPLIIIGLFVEKYYTPRPAFLPNSIALILWSRNIVIEDPLLELMFYYYLFIGLIVGVVGMLCYIERRKWSDSTYMLTRIFYGSYTVGILIVLSYLYFYSDFFSIF